MPAFADRGQGIESAATAGAMQVPAPGAGLTSGEKSSPLRGEFVTVVAHAGQARNGHAVCRRQKNATHAKVVAVW